MTKRESILQALKAKLVGITGVLDASVYRSRVIPLSRGKTPAVSIEPLQDSGDQSQINFIDWILTVRVSVIVRGDIPDQVADPIVQDVHSKIMSDLSLGGLCMDIQAGLVNYELLDADQPAGIVSMNYSVRYRTQVKDLTT